ncbi:MAG TPA: branched-chain amino acid ABC transporter permease [Bordetella sp.]
MYGSPRYPELAGLLVIVAVGFVLPWLLPEYFLYTCNMLMTYAILAIGLDLLLGWSGQFAFAHIAFFGIGIYGTALLESRLGVPYVLSVAASAGLAGLLGIVIGLPATRLRMVYLALATYAFAECAQWVFRSWDQVTGGSDGLRFPPPDIFGYTTGTDSRAFPVVALMLALVLGAALYLTRSSLGRQMCAIRDSEHVAAASGIDVRRIKVIAFAISAVFAGIAGGTYTLFQSFVNADVLGASQLVTVLTMIVIGGSGSIVGVLLGVAVIGLLPELLRIMPQSMLVWQEFIYGAILVLSVVGMPKGLWGLIKPRFGKKSKETKTAPVPPTHSTFTEIAE